MGFGWQEIDKTLDLGYIRVAGLHPECKPAVLFDPPNFCPRTMTHTYIHTHTVEACEHGISDTCNMKAATAPSTLLEFVFF